MIAGSFCSADTVYRYIAQILACSQLCPRHLGAKLTCSWLDATAFVLSCMNILCAMVTTSRKIRHIYELNRVHQLLYAGLLCRTGVTGDANVQFRVLTPLAMQKLDPTAVFPACKTSMLQSAIYHFSEILVQPSNCTDAKVAALKTASHWTWLHSCLLHAITEWCNEYMQTLLPSLCDNSQSS